MADDCGVCLVVHHEHYYSLVTERLAWLIWKRTVDIARVLDEESLVAGRHHVLGPLV